MFFVSVFPHVATAVVAVFIILCGGAISTVLVLKIKWQVEELVVLLLLTKPELLVPMIFAIASVANNVVHSARRIVIVVATIVAGMYGIMITHVLVIVLVLIVKLLVNLLVVVMLNVMTQRVVA
jgi:hypothetical protein